MNDETGNETAGNEEGRTLDARALKALAHPLRVRIFDLLAERGPQTASSLATLVGETSGATSYHLRALAAHDLIREVPGRGTARERWWERPQGRINVPGPDDTMTPSNRAAAQIVTGEFFRLRYETLMAYLNRTSAGETDEWRDAALIMSSNLDLTLDQLEGLKNELTAVIDAAIERYRGQEGPGVRRVSLRAELFDLPIAADGRRAATEEES
ncbi:DNA-binding transcriptional ArsR family regulator [Microbacterium resistens]|uniref:DNA-binding transcriptional ArsR family regulator n=1 Tax=Microbacterium resistens TaxID=156977 RepID=A0ABU1SFQ6_9MICO|nr:helix-turn-helix domain-containing protein [Microbacterium resistens]MDR6868415.1 DNA-binding transcriptional ArsR family regulator [Microbacterium resistens]